MTTKTTAAKLLEIPLAACRLAEEETVVEVMESDSDGAPRKFKVEAHTGKIMAHWLFGQLAVDLDGITIPKRAVPSLLDHDPAKRLGSAGKNRIEKGVGLVSEVTFLKTNPDAQAVLQDADEGFPWQASIMVPPTIVEEVLAGAEAEVNGQTMHGPGLIFRESNLREVSFTALGVDDDTSAEEMAASGKKLTARLSITRPTNQPTQEDPQMTNPEPTAAPKNLAELRAAFPELCSELHEAGLAAGVIQERERAVEILDACHGQELPRVLSFVKDGVDAKAAFRSLLDNRDTDRAAQLALRSNPGDAQAVADVTPAAPTGNEVNLAAMSAEERGTHEWNTDKAIQAEFPDVEVYLAYKKNAAFCTTHMDSDAYARRTVEA